MSRDCLKSCGITIVVNISHLLFMSEEDINEY